MRQIRTDLAMESASAAGDQELPGVHVSTWEEAGVSITEVKIERAEGARLLGKPEGVYVTLECGGLREKRVEAREAMASLLGEELSRLLPGEQDKPVLVIGLGNRQVTPDSLGPLTVDGTLVTRHLFRELPDTVDSRMSPVCAVAPGVLGITGLETLEIVQGIVDHVDPCAVIAIDALSSRAISRIGTTVQLTNTGIQPGSGVGNHRKALSRETLGVPVISLGVPTVIYAASIVRDAMESIAPQDGEDHSQAFEQMGKDLLKGEIGEMIVTPREVDDIVKDVAQVLSGGINKALHPGLSNSEMQIMRD
ncbi:GPR endopeptidase [Eubacteriales bacterium OttesenSCG-928-N13]|nr:GPR endopeptidase [Eubacteriales bacterium OttesenSCG-928-N13]